MRVLPWKRAGTAAFRWKIIPLLPFATLDDYAGQPTALDADAVPAASFVLVQRLPLAPTFIKYEAHGQAGANGLRGALYVEYYECITPQLAQTMYREGKANGLHNFPETAADAADGSIYCRTLVDGNKVLRVLLFQYQEEQIPLQELEAICKADLLHRVNQLKPAKPAEFLYFFSIQNTKQTAPPPYLAAWGGGALLL